MPRFTKEALNKMVVKSHDHSIISLTTICHKFNIQKGKIHLNNIFIEFCRQNKRKLHPKYHE